MKIDYLTPIIIFWVVIIVYDIITNRTKERKVICLDQGGTVEKGTIMPDFERPDIKKYFEECNQENISYTIGKHFLIGLYNTFPWEKEPRCPKLNESYFKFYLFEEDEIEEIFEYLKKNFYPAFQWEYEQILEFKTFKEILSYLNNKRDNQTVKSAR